MDLILFVLLKFATVLQIDWIPFCVFFFFVSENLPHLTRDVIFGSKWIGYKQSELRERA